MTSVLSDKDILVLREEGRVVIEPFKRENLSTSSYDVTLGTYYFRERKRFNCPIYNPYDENHVKGVWGSVCEAKPLGEYGFHKHNELTNIERDELVIFIEPGETILAHTQEFIGGRSGGGGRNGPSVTTMMKARSSMGRSFIEVCKCAGWGDVGYTNRWTMEITNNSRYYSIPLVVGRRIAQIVFFQTGTLADDAACYVEGSGKYQTTRDLEQLREQWSPNDMLPRMYRDREIAEAKKRRFCRHCPECGIGNECKGHQD